MIDEKTQQKLMDYLFDEMAPVERIEFEKTIRESKKLQDKLQQLKSTQSLLENYPMTDLSESFDETVLQESPSAGNNLNSNPVNKIWIAAAAILLIALFFGLFQSVQFGQSEHGYYLTFGNPPSQVENSGISEEEMNQIIEQLRVENTLLMNAMVEQVQQEQLAQFNESLTVLADYYEERRNRDLLIFTEGLLQLEENTTSRINRTNQALNGIIYALSND